MTTCTFRTGNVEDIEAVYQLNKDVFSEYWSRTSLFSALESGYDLLLCESEATLVAYMLSLSILDETQIMQIAVNSDYRRQGLASRLTRTFITATTEINSITLEVRISNDAARQCYTQLGFEEVGYRKNYYAATASGLREDAVLMTKELA